MNNYFEQAFGLPGRNGHPEIIEFSVNKQQGRYIDAYPLHQSQKLLSEDDDQMIFQLRVMVTHDLVQQFLAFGSDVEVLKPAHMRKMIAKQLAGALEYYRKKR